MNYFLISLAVGLALFSYLSRYYCFNTTYTIPQVTETWWTHGTEKSADNKVKPYRVSFSQEMVDDLRYRLKHTRNLTPPLKDTAWTYGTNTDVLQKLLNYWANDYDFRKREDYINQYSQFQTNIQGLDIHFLHVKPKNPEGKRVLPLLILHGWPGSVMEFYKIIPLLTTARPEHDFVFEVIAPSLPGFGFSSGATIPGLSASNMAVVLKNLMLRLGFDKFYVQGGDWGACITTDMSILFPQHVLGMHSNLCSVINIWSLLKELFYYYLPSSLSPSGDFYQGISLNQQLIAFLQETGYFHIQATKVDTIGVGLCDSPAGLASYIIEKFSTGTNYSYKFREDGGLLEKFTYDELIDNLMMYWAPNSMTTAMRIYAALFSKQNLNMLSLRTLPVTVPSACVQFPHEIKLYPENILRDKYVNLVRVTKMPRGGHFAAMEEPKLLADDIWAFVGQMKVLKKNNKENSKDKKNDLPNVRTDIRALLSRFSSRTLYVRRDRRAMWKTTTVILVLAIGITQLFLSNTVVDVPDLPETFWGPEKNKGASKEIRPFVINVPKSVIDDLNQRLENAREFVEPLEDAAWTYGVSSTYLKDVVQYWRTKYNWTERQALLNKYPQYVTNIQGLNIHFYHVKPQLPKDRKLKVLPLLLLHGWPGSVVEFQKMIPMLTTPRPDKDFVFEVIAPSLPGYAFSQAAVRNGLGPSQMSVIFKNLMLRLGFNKFYAQGGDWGSFIVSHLSGLYPDNILGGHMNMCANSGTSSMVWRLIGTVLPWLVVNNEYHSKMYPLSSHVSRLLEESGYMHIQASKPDTLGIAVAASPTGLAAYLLEKFSTWTNPEYRFRPDGGLLEKYTMDELLDNVMLYWVTNSLTTSVRIYAEQFNKAHMSSKIDEIPVNVPTACAVFPYELLYTPESLLRDKYTNLIQFNHLPRGGHFAAFEEPALLANDVYEFVSKTEDIAKKAGKDKSNAEKKIKEPTKI
ncbi:PREDICTED: uncharacterized protein LOC106749308 [Dinoponera quadriceps]|uniref:Uncharacterized protein LOC106749308 n=1 Tax=Dinoponera quadriceps TaxID=609295 RepID=A0A6P3Y1E4_DINQU|nr:PREDICTED: uncharacterized protein LOC106749308 [Dinoponera quadriceps]